MDGVSEDRAKHAGGPLARVRWLNVARLLFVIGAAGVLVHGPPSLGDGSPSRPALGLPEEVLRPGMGRRPSAIVRPPPVLRRAAPPAARPATASRRAAASNRGSARGIRARRARPGRSRARPAAPAALAPVPVAPPPVPAAPPVGEFGP